MNRLWLGAAVAALGVLAGCSLIDLDTPRAYACVYGKDPSPDAGLSIDDPSTQCAPGWRCGVNDRCHAIGVPSALACNSDLDCEANWRCGPDGVCLDPSSDALRPDADAGQALVVALGTHLPAPDLAAISGEVSIATGCYEQSAYGQPYSYVFDGGLVKITAYEGGRPVYLDGGPFCGETLAPAYVTADVVSVRLPSKPIALAEALGKTYALLAGGGLCTFVQPTVGTIDGGCVAGLLPSSTNQLRAPMDNSYNSRVLAFSATEYSIINPLDDSITDPASVLSPDGGIIPINDLISMGNESSSEGELVAATDAGLFVTHLNDSPWFPGDAGEWVPVEADGFACATDGYGSNAPVRLKASPFQNSEQLTPVLSVLSFDPLDPYDPYQVVAYPAVNDGGEFGSCPTLPADGSDYVPSWYADWSLDCSSACPAGSRLIDFHATVDPSNAGQLDYYSRCSTVAGVQQVSMGNEYCGQTAQYLPVTSRFTSPVKVASAVSSGVLETDAYGHAWFDTQGNLELAAMSLDRAPSSIMGSVSSGLSVFASALSSSALGDGIFEAVPAQRFDFIPQAGLVSTGLEQDQQIQVTVEGQNRWEVILGQANTPLQFGVLQFGHTDEDTRVIAIATSQDALLGPYLAATQQSAQGDDVLVVTSFDSLLATDVTVMVNNPDAGLVTDTLDFSTIPALQVELTPIPHGQITSLMLLPPDPAVDAGSAPYAEGYLVTTSRLFHITAPNSVVWRDDEVLLPTEDAIGALVPIQLFHDGPRGRVGFQDGTVVSLPSRVPLAPPLPDGGGLAQDFAQVCQHPFALGAGGLYRLVTDGTNPIGQWQSVPIDPSLLPLEADGGTASWAGGRLFSSEQELLVFHPLGWGYRVTGLDCD